MKVKVFKHNLIEECNLCHKVIYTDKDNWVSMIDLVGEKIEVIKFYHRFCLTDLIKGQGRIIAQNFQEKVQKMAGNLLKGIQPMVDKMNKEEKLSYEIVEQH